MIDPTRIKFPNINKPFLKGLFWLIVLLFLATIFSAPRGIYDVFLRKPELRKETLQLGYDAHYGNEIWIQRAIIIHNRGNDDAKNVQIKCLIPNGKITRLNIISEEDYSNNNTTGQAVACSYSLTRLAAGSKLIILMWSTVSTINLSNTQEPLMPIVSASFDGGIALSSNKQTALEEVQNIGNTLTNGVDVIIQQLDKKIQIDTTIRQMTLRILPLWGIYFSGGTAANSEINSGLFTTFMLMVIAWLLLPRVWAGLSIALLFSLVIWLFTEFWVVTIWLSIPLILGVVAFWTTRSYKELILLIICLVSLIALLISNTTAAEWSCLFSNRFSTFFVCDITTIHGGILVGYTLFALYLIFIEL